MIKIVILGKVQSQLRPIFNRSTGAAADPKKCRDYKAKVKETARRYVGWDFELLDEPLRVELDIYKEIPKSWSKKKKQQALDGELFDISTPDVDNLFKGVTDGLTKTIWRDDSVIVEAEIKKFLSEVPRAEVRIYTMKELKEGRESL